jgi:hypothetical protein
MAETGVGKRTVDVLQALLIIALVLLGAGCSASDSPTASAAKPVASVCPNAWRADWQRLANEVRAPVYCPSWLPQPLDGRFAGSAFNGQTVDPDRSYLIKFLWFDASSPAGVNEVHVNFRGYPGHTAIPICDDTLTVGGKTVHKPIPCFSDRKGQKRFGRTIASVYTANQGADLWHVVYAWRYRGSLYSLSEHVVAPYSYKQVIANLDRMMRRLVLVKPKTQLNT